MGDAALTIHFPRLSRIPQSPFFVIRLGSRGIGRFPFAESGFGRLGGDDGETFAWFCYFSWWGRLPSSAAPMVKG
jgi:hypothetical protein